MKNIHCAVFGHDFVLSNEIKEYKCKNCKQQFTTDSNGNLIPLTPKFKEINSVLKRIYLNKQKRKALIFDR